MAAPDQIDATIQDIVQRIRSTRNEMEALEACINDMKGELRGLLEARGENWSDAEGYARIISPGERIGYDTEALDHLIIEDPLRYGWLKDYRITSTVQSRIQVK